MGGLTTEAPPGILGPLGKFLREHLCTPICLLFACSMSLHSALLDFLEPVEHISPSKIDRGDYARGRYESLPSIANIALDALPHFMWIVTGSSLVDFTKHAVSKRSVRRSETTRALWCQHRRWRLNHALQSEFSTR
jgi:hypothetical protein